MTHSPIETAVCAAHDRLCVALATSNAAAFVAQFCLDEVNVWGPEPDDSAQSPAELLALAKRIGARLKGYSFGWSHRTVLAADDVAWFTAVGTISRAGPALLERRPYRMQGVLVPLKGQWLWRLLEARDGVVEEAGRPAASAAG